MSHIARRRASNTLSLNAEDCLRYIKSTAVKSVDSDVEVYTDEEIPSRVVVAVFHDGSGFTPLSTVSISMFWGEQETIEDAFDSLHHVYLDIYSDYVLEVAEESGGDYDHTEGWDGKVFTLTLKEAISVVLEANLKGSVYIDDQDVLNIDKGWLKSEGFL